jgi:L-fucose isomerase-like protein
MEFDVINHNIVLGIAPTRRFIFSKEDAYKEKLSLYQRLKELNIQYVDIDDINPEGLLFDPSHIQPIVEKFQNAKVDAVFLPHCNFGTEELVCEVARKLNKPVLLWGPRDEAPLPNGSRTRDSQCGLFATGKVLRRYRIKFTYLPNDSINDLSFERGIRNFLAAVNVVRTIKNLNVLQVSTRPFDFLTTMYNEGELIERFGIRIKPIPLSDVIRKAKGILAAKPAAFNEIVDFTHTNMDVCIPEDGLERIVAFKMAIKEFMLEYECSVGAVQCWNALEDDFQIRACASNSMLTEDGLPIACETDIHGAITMAIAQAAVMSDTRPMFADWTVRHPTNPNGELLQHCGPYPISLRKDGVVPKLTTPFALGGDTPGSITMEAKGGDLTILRFDGDNGEYKLLAGNAKTIEGPYSWGTYSWIEVKDWLKLEKKLVEGPYIHHCVAIHGSIVPVVYEACKYIDGLSIDLYDDDEEQCIQNYLLGR